MFTRVSKMYNSYDIPMTSEQQEEFEALDDIRKKGMLLAEKRCRKMKMGAIRWSPIIQQAMDDI